MREQKIKSLPSFPNTGETKFIANYLHAVRTPLPSGGVGGGFLLFLVYSGGVGGGLLLFFAYSGGVGGGLPPLSHLFGRGWGWAFSPQVARRADVKSRPYPSAGR